MLNNSAKPHHSRVPRAKHLFGAPHGCRVTHFVAVHVELPVEFLPGGRTGQRTQRGRTKTHEQRRHLQHVYARRGLAHRQAGLSNPWRLRQRSTRRVSAREKQDALHCLEYPIFSSTTGSKIEVRGSSGAPKREGTAWLITLQGHRIVFGKPNASRHAQDLILRFHTYVR